MQEVAPLLANLYTYMLRCGYIPESMKRGVILTLHKGGKRGKDKPNNYRAITLSSVVLKLYEMVLLDRCQDTLLEKINTQQGGFQYEQSYSTIGHQRQTGMYLKLDQNQLM